MEFGELLKSFLLGLQGLFRVEIVSDSLSLPQALAISSIPDRGIDMSTLSQTLGIDNSTATRMVDGLIKKGWAQKEKDPHDGRVVIVYLTEFGEKIQEEIEEKIDDLGEEIESRITIENQNELREALSSFQWTLSKYILPKFASG